jgi:NAD(P) transhydrogenase subunit alpha
MRIGIPRETASGETRVALVPPEAEALQHDGHETVIERWAGAAAGFRDEEYASRGVRVVSRGEVWDADVIVQVRTPAAHPSDAESELGELRPGKVLVGLGDPLGSAQTIQQVAERGVTSFALELLPRITRAQAMDVLSSQSALAGYKAVLVAADRLNRVFPMMTTAAGTLPPTRVLVVGAGVAGLQAIATARRLGAVAQAYDVRPAAREQVESVGGRFLELPLETTGAEGAGGYAAALTEEFYARQRELLSAAVAGSDVVITTAQVPGQRAPVLVTADMVAGMAPGSVLVDIAAAQGGNCGLSRPDEIVEVHDVTVLAPTNLPATVAAHASRLYGKNVGNFLRHVLTPDRLRLDLDDQIIRDTLVTDRGEIVHPVVRQLLGLEAFPPDTEAPPLTQPPLTQPPLTQPVAS